MIECDLLGKLAKCFCINLNLKIHLDISGMVNEVSKTTTSSCICCH